LNPTIKNHTVIVYQNISYHDIDHDCAILETPAIQFIFLLLLQYANITLYQECHQNLQSHGCSSIPTQWLIHQLLLLHARFEHFRNSVSTKTKSVSWQF
jgi:hypothetical protein